jgi:peptide/nickel transport system substrate-binding protein
MKKILWLMVSCLMVFSLVLASCGSPSTTPQTPGEGGAEPSEEPRYGGTFSFVFSEPFGFDPYYNFMMECKALFLCNEELLMGDWAKGPAGTGETSWESGCLGFAGLLTGQLCESWEIKDSETLRFKIRKGVHWWDKPPMNGRELTADDVAWGIKRLWTQGVHTVIGPPDQALQSAEVVDGDYLELKFAPYALGVAGVVYSSAWAYIVPREVVETFGDMKDWHNVCGTGAFMLTDYTPGSSLTYKKNPNYWGTDPCGPGKGNQLPYVDECKQLIITDASTQTAALRTGKIDFSLYTDLSLDDALLLMKQYPDLKYKTINGTDNQLYFRVDKQDLPFKDIKVRQALTLAINEQEIIDDYYNGEAELLGTPYPPFKAWEKFYTPLEEMPDTPQLTDEGSECSVKELFTYDPEKAKKLLAEAGYPNGFKCSILSGDATSTDFLSIIKEYFADVGVSLDIQQVESGVFRSMRRDRSYDCGVYAASPTALFPYDMHNIRSESFDCFSYFEHPYTREIYNEQRTYVAIDDEKYAALLKKSVPFILEECVGAWLPTPHAYRMWWPWLKNYHGEGSLGIDDQMLMANYVWIDQDLKKSMGY